MKVSRCHESWNRMENTCFVIILLEFCIPSFVHSYFFFSCIFPLWCLSYTIISWYRDSINLIYNYLMPDISMHLRTPISQYWTSCKSEDEISSPLSSFPWLLLPFWRFSSISFKSLSCLIFFFLCCLWESKAHSFSIVN